MSDLLVHVAGQELPATWTDDNPETREAIVTALPLEGEATRWGDELYFRTAIDVPPETTQTEVPVGAIAYWPQGNAICLFWGPTPASHGEEPRAAGPVSVVAELETVAPLETHDGSAAVRIEHV